MVCYLSLLFSVHVVFGQVISGQDLVRQLEDLPVDRNSRPLQDAVITNCGELVKQVKSMCIYILCICILDLPLNHDNMELVLQLKRTKRKRSELHLRMMRSPKVNQRRKNAVNAKIKRRKRNAPNQATKRSK